MLANGSKVVYNKNTGKYYDNYQSQKITSALTEIIWNPTMEKIGSHYCPSFVEVAPAFNLYTYKGYEDSYFHTYYDGDIEKFYQTEDISIRLGYYDKSHHWIDSEMFIIAEDKQSWQLSFRAIDEMIGYLF